MPATTTLRTRPASRSGERASRPGRPRHTGPSPQGRDPREEILAAAARLFVEKSYTDASTREISEEVGIRQASIYYHFAGGKEQILAELLKRSIRPTLELVDTIETLCAKETPHTALYLLVLTDVRTLAEAMHNCGLLARLPDVQRSASFDTYRKTRRELGHAYSRLAALVEGGLDADPLSLGDMLLNLVEVVINIRRGGGEVNDQQADSIAAACLRVCGASDEDVTAAARAAAALRDQAYAARAGAGEQ